MIKFLIISNDVILGGVRQEVYTYIFHAGQFKDFHGDFH